MRADRPVPDDVDDRIARLAAAWAVDPAIAAVFLFGSRARGEAAHRSDVDLAVVLVDGLTESERYRKGIELGVDATLRLGTDAVDVVVLEDAPAVLGHRVLRDGRLVAEPQPARRVAVAERVIHRYIDEAPLREALDRALSARVREGRFAR